MITTDRPPLEEETETETETEEQNEANKKPGYMLAPGPITPRLMAAIPPELQDIDEDEGD